jgi:acyl-CoA thioester hydrolase
MSDDFSCWYPVQIRFRDLDPLHVNNTVYFIYFEEARSHYFNQLRLWLEQWPSGEEHQHQVEEDEEPHNPRIQTGRHGHCMLVKEITCTYMLPLVRSDEAEVVYE